MNIEREVKVRDAIKYCIENFDSQTATNRIVEFWKDELKLQEQQYNVANVVGQIEQLKCECKQATFTRTVDEDFNPMCGKCGKKI